MPPVTRAKTGKLPVQRKISEADSDASDSRLTSPEGKTDVEAKTDSTSLDDQGRHLYSSMCVLLLLMSNTIVHAHREITDAASGQTSEDTGGGGQSHDEETEHGAF